MSKTCCLVCIPKIYCQCLPVNTSSLLWSPWFQSRKGGGLKGQFNRSLGERSLTPSVASCTFSLRAASCQLLLLPASECGGKPVPISTQHRSTLPGFLSSLKHTFPALFFTSVLCHSLIHPCPDQLLWFSQHRCWLSICQAGERFPDCTVPWPNPAPAGELGTH